MGVCGEWRRVSGCGQLGGAVSGRCAAMPVGERAVRQRLGVVPDIFTLL